MRKSVLQVILLLANAISTTISVFSTNQFTWRGNVLRLNNIVPVTDPALPFKMETDQMIPFKMDTSEVYDASNDDENTEERFPLLPEPGAAFPGHVQLVFCNELKFRELMSDSQTMYSNKFIRCRVDESGCIDRIGLLCRIKDSRNLKNGQAMYFIESLNKICIDGMIVRPGRSYLSSTKTSPVNDEYLNDEEIEANEQLSIKLFNTFKRFIRLSRMVSTDKNDDEDFSSGLYLTKEFIQNRPAQEDYRSSSASEKMERHNKLSYAFGNAVTLSPLLAQKLFVAPTSKRLLIVTTIIEEVLDNLSKDIAKVTSSESREWVDKLLQVQTAEDLGLFEDLATPPGWKDFDLQEVVLDSDEEFETADNGSDDVMQ